MKKKSLMKSKEFVIYVKKNLLMIKNTIKSELTIIIAGKYRGAAHCICNLRYKIPKEIPVVFHNGPTYDYHFIIRQLVKECKGNFEFLGENTEKYIAFSVPFKKSVIMIKQ